MEDTAQLFELEVALPETRLTNQAKRLVGFGPRYERMRQDLRLLIEQDGLEKWSRTHYGVRVALLDVLQDRYPLAVFHGDVGTGKTATAEAISNSLSRDLGKDAMLFKLSTRVRGSGNVGEMSTLVNKAFDVVTKEAGRSKVSFLVIDEADSLASSRVQSQSHHEDKVAVNTLIQKVDDSRRFKGRVVVILCTNRFSALDPAITRRAACIEEFSRPNDQEREELIRMDCAGLGLSDADIKELIRLTGPNGPHKATYTFSDLRTRLIPQALALAYPDRKIKRQDFENAVMHLKPTPPIVL